MQLLTGHISSETAFVINDYPYGFKLRCKIRYWLEFNQTRGVRLISQTSNPKRGDVWNKSKASTYAYAAGAMFLDNEQHVQWSQLHEYSTAQEATTWRDTYGEGLPDSARERLNSWIKMKTIYETSHAEKLAKTG